MGSGNTISFVWHVGGVHADLYMIRFSLVICWKDYQKAKRDKLGKVVLVLIFV